MTLVRSKQAKSETTLELDELTAQHPQVKHFVEFISSSKRGIVK